MALEKATITNLVTNEAVPVMFNPQEYVLDSGNSFAEIGIPGLATPPIQYVRGNARQLRMDLFFDTYEVRADVRGPVRTVTALMDQDPTTLGPPTLLFSWGSLNFNCVLESVAQRFTMFLDDGTPVRATLSVTFREYAEVDVEIKGGLFIGPPTVHNVLAGETVSQIAGEVMGDPGAWRVIADANDIDNPRTPPAGDALIIPANPPAGPNRD